MAAPAIRIREPEGEAKTKLMAAAEGLFARKGYAATTVREIVAAAGVTPPVLYYHFGNKEGLYLTLMREAWDDFDKKREASVGGPGSAMEKILRLGRWAADLSREYIGVLRIMTSIYYGPPQGAPFFDFDSYHMRFRETIRRLVKEGIDNGEFRPGNPETMAWAILGAFRVSMEIELCHPELSLGSAGLVEVLQTIFRGIEADVARQEELS